MILSEYPSQWNSVHRPIRFVYDHEQRTLVQVLNNGGFANFWVASAYDYTPVAGEQIYVSSGIYEGYHVVSSVSGQFITTTTTYTSNDLDSPNVLYIRLPEIEVYSGYLPGEEYPTQLPLTLVATFNPKNNPGNQVVFDLSEYLKSIFQIKVPVEGIDFNMFNRFRVVFDSHAHEYYQVLNSSILTADINSLYVDTGAYLNTNTPPVLFSCGRTILSSLTGNVVVNKYVDNANTSGSDFNNDFNNDYE